MAGETPYTIAGTVYDTDGTTAVASATVRVYDWTQAYPEAVIETTTNSTGQYLVDLANLTNSTGYTYANSDVIIVEVKITTPSRFEHWKHTVDTTAGVVDKNLYLKNGKTYVGDRRLVAGTVSNTHSSAARTALVERTTLSKLAIISTEAGGTSEFNYESGIKFDEGIFILDHDGTDYNGGLTTNYLQPALVTI